jgi:tRNA pseudouridine38-40 synthase
LKRWKVVCAYDGSGFSGWQSQLAGTSVQDVIESRLADVLGVATRVHGSGRTDSGVHARGQVFHFDAAWQHGPEKLAAALRHRLSKAIQIVSVRSASPEFHARFSATGKIYSYHIHLGDADPFTRPYCWVILKALDVDAVCAAAEVLEGRHDFRAFSALNGRDPDEASGTVRDLRRFQVRARGSRISMEAEADGFLYKMVRSLVGAAVAVGEGKLTLSEIRSIRSTGVRTARIQTAPAQGLFLDRVLYR